MATLTFMLGWASLSEAWEAITQLAPQREEGTRPCPMIPKADWLHIRITQGVLLWSLL